MVARAAISLEPFKDIIFIDLIQILTRLGAALLFSGIY